MRKICIIFKYLVIINIQDFDIFKLKNEKIHFYLKFKLKSTIFQIFKKKFQKKSKKIEGTIRSVAKEKLING